MTSNVNFYVLTGDELILLLNVHLPCKIDINYNSKYSILIEKNGSQNFQKSINQALKYMISMFIDDDDFCEYMCMQSNDFSRIYHKNYSYGKQKNTSELFINDLVKSCFLNIFKEKMIF